MAEEKKPCKKQRQYMFILTSLIITLVLLLVLLGLGLFLLLSNQSTSSRNGSHKRENAVSWEDKEKVERKKQESVIEEESLKQDLARRKKLMEEANFLALGHDYDNAIALLESYSGKEGDYQAYPDIVSAIKNLKKEKASLKLYGGIYDSIREVNHVFFHILIQDTAKAFDGDYKSIGYNMYMTTVSEFKKILKAMYDQGYVLIKMSDLVKIETLEDGSTRFVEKEIYLREGKKPFVMSQDDVCYYTYMEGDGFASKIIIGEDNEPTCEMVLEDGSIVRGAFDLVPILNEFVREYPDFSYQGARGVLAFTGYEGILGYRTNDINSPTYEQERKEAKKVVESLKAQGWEFASHSWGHRDLNKASLELLKEDTNRWLEEVGSILGPTSIYIFPYGIDIEGTTGGYGGEKFKFLKGCGFTMFSGVFKEPWMEIHQDYLRMARRPLDGQAMLEFPQRLMDLFDVEDVIDADRPPKDW